MSTEENAVGRGPAETGPARPEGPSPKPTRSTIRGFPHRKARRTTRGSR
ncbi:hypothetical protein ACFWTE_16410 [Nocardiopsis sp. NPDC058631]